MVSNLALWAILSAYLPQLLHHQTARPVRDRTAGAPPRGRARPAYSAVCDSRITPNHNMFELVRLRCTRTHLDPSLYCLWSCMHVVDGMVISMVTNYLYFVTLHHCPWWYHALIEKNSWNPSWFKWSLVTDCSVLYCTDLPQNRWNGPQRGDSGTAVSSILAPPPRWLHLHVSSPFPLSA